jgi:anion-transporting  ArsA/GET3 family ATPase
VSRLDEILESRIVVCTGAGGVGKTTISAAIALEASGRGLKTLVVTIDPAKRLANSLGLKRLSNKPKRISAKHFEASDLKPSPLDAMMLDTKRTFDELVHRYATDKAKAERIIRNRFYQAISGALSGTHEYMAMEKLYELHSEGIYDLIVIDTPPTRNALDFLEAPKRLTSFLEDRLLKWFLLPAIGGGKGIFRAVNFGAVAFLRVVRRVVGPEVMKDVADFLANFEGMYEGFKERAQAVFELLRQESSAFVVVTSPTEQAVDEAVFFASTLNSYGLPFKGLVVNRVHPRFNGAVIEPTGDLLVDQLIKIREDLERIGRREDASLKRLKAEIPQHRWARVPYLTREVVDLAALSQVASHIFL